MKRTSIRYRLMILMIFLTTLPVITVTWIATNNTRNSVEKEIINANNSRLRWADQYLNELIQQMDTLFYTLQINDRLMKSVITPDNPDNPDIGVQFSAQNDIWNTLISAYGANYRKIDELTLYSHLNQKAFSVNSTNSGVIFSLDIHKGVWSGLESKPVNLYFKQNGGETYVFHSLNRFEDRKMFGGLAVRISGDVWREVSDILSSEAESSIFILNDDRELLSGSSVPEEGSELQDELAKIRLTDPEVKFHRTSGYFYFMKKIADGQLTVVKAIPAATVTQSSRATITAGILTGSLFAAASVLLSILVSLRISRPIVSLAKTMRMTEVQNFELKSVKSRDEIGMLEHGYNSMMQRIKELIEVEYQHQIDVKNAQLQALQAQINPHFLNNTLNLIGGMALAKEAPEIYHITRVIGDLLRYSISTEGDMVALQSELTHMKNYLFIQEQRFAGRCTVHISADERAQTSTVPKFTLQPIVENAFEHGLQKKEGKWEVEIRIRKIGCRVAVMVKDNGVGMEPDRLLQLRGELRQGSGAAEPYVVWNGKAQPYGQPYGKDQPNARPQPQAGGPQPSGETPQPQAVQARLADPAKADEAAQSGPRRRRGIGLRNVDSRLKLQFGPAFGVRLFSSAGAGTLAVILLPISDGGAIQHA